MPKDFVLTKPCTLYYGNKMYKYSWPSSQPYQFNDKTKTKNGEALFTFLLRYARALVVKYDIQIVLFYEKDLPPLDAINVPDELITKLAAETLRTCTHASVYSVQ